MKNDPDHSFMVHRNQTHIKKQPPTKQSLSNFDKATGKNLPLVRSFVIVCCFVSMIIFFTRYIVTIPAMKDVTIVPLIVVVDDEEEEDMLSCILSLLLTVAVAVGGVVLLCLFVFFLFGHNSLKV